MNQFTHPVGRRSATLTGYVQQTSSALPNLNVCPAVLICPGGGYAYCTDREAEPVALAFLNAGYNAFVLRYTVSTSCPGAEVFDNALAEAEESLIYLHDHAEELHIDPDKIAVLGFSAGAHLTGALGTMGRIRPRRPAAGLRRLRRGRCRHGRPDAQCAEPHRRPDAAVLPVRDPGRPARARLELAGLCLPPGGAAHSL